MINIEDFAKVEIKIGKIVSVEDIEGSEKLYKLLVDFGEERERQVLSGIKKYFQKEFLIGKQFAFATNLEPRKMVGLVSEAMILGTGDGEDLAFLSPTKEVKNGSEMR